MPKRRALSKRARETRRIESESRRWLETMSGSGFEGYYATYGEDRARYNLGDGGRQRMPMRHAE